MKRNEPITRIMTTDITTVHTGQKLSEVQRALAEGGFHHMPVVSGKKLVGILTSTDLLRISYEYGADPRQTNAVMDHTVSIEQLMKVPVTLNQKQTVREAIAHLAEAKYHSVPIVDDEDNLVGLVTTTDLLRYVMEQY